MGFFSQLPPFISLGKFSFSWFVSFLPLQMDIMVLTDGQGETFPSLTKKEVNVWKLSQTWVLSPLLTWQRLSPQPWSLEEQQQCGRGRWGSPERQLTEEKGVSVFWEVQCYNRWAHLYCTGPNPTLALPLYVKAGIFSCFCPLSIKARSSVVLLERRQIFVLVFNEDLLFSGCFVLLEAVK